ncbi:MAG: pilus assembly PilX N-terminal domain-containing protein [Desulfosalsimonadaceae bacterium]
MLRKLLQLPLARDKENGSVIVLALMILAIMTVIGIMSADTIMTENFIVRNTAIHKQNVNLVEAALMEGLQDVIQIDATDPSNLDPDSSPSDWIVSKDTNWTTDDWYKPDSTGQLLTSGNSDTPELVTHDKANSISILKDRGEDDNNNLRIAIVGWELESGSTAKMTGGGAPPCKQGRVLGEYVSLDSSDKDNGFGMLRMELGVRRYFY